MKEKFRVFLSVSRLTAVLFVLLPVLVAFIGCSSSSSPLTGIFIDSPVSGLNYTTLSSSGVTDANGQFLYHAHETVSFSVGTLSLGSGRGAAQMTPLSITPGATSASDQIVNNKLILLQTLDADGDLNNGIQITEAIRVIVSANAATINFDQTTTAFRTNLAPLMTALNTGNVFTDASFRGARTVRAAAAALAHFTRSMNPRITVATTYGQIQGFEPATTPAGTCWQWLGVPYAKPPIGDLRWKAPENPVAWTGVRQAVSWGDQAAQSSVYAAYGEGGNSEDCLYLNITAPKNASNLPVMVWFHGGAFGILTANSLSFNNANSLPAKGVVLVTVNHRLGVFGYLAHPQLSTESGYSGSGNYGQMDIIKALEWIKANIAAFGGNPNNVTLFGQSGGGGKAISLMASPLAKNLFHKVICQSGIAVKANIILNHSDLGTSEAKGTDLFSRLGVTTLAQARALPWSTIINADMAAFGANAWLRYLPNIDRRYLTDTMENLIKAGLQNDVPFLAGATSSDLVAGANLSPGITEQMPWRATNNKARQFIYYWRYVPSGWAAAPLNVGAYHGLELVYVFNYPASFVSHLLLGLALKNSNPATPLTVTDIGLSPADPLFASKVIASTGWGATDLSMVDKAMSIWTNFAKTGDPSVSGVITWPVYTTASDAYVEIGMGGTITAKTGVAAAFGNP